MYIYILVHIYVHTPTHIYMGTNCGYTVCCFKVVTQYSHNHMLPICTHPFLLCFLLSLHKPPGRGLAPLHTHGSHLATLAHALPQPHIHATRSLFQVQLHSLSLLTLRLAATTILAHLHIHPTAPTHHHSRTYHTPIYLYIYTIFVYICPCICMCIFMHLHAHHLHALFPATAHT